MATPSICNIIKSFPNAETTIIGSSVSTELLSNFPLIVKRYVLKKRLIEDLSFFRKCGFFDIIISYRSSYRSYFYKFFIKSKSKYQYKKFFFKGHQVEKYNDFINHSLKLNLDAGELKLFTSLNSQIKTQRKKIGINPGAKYGSAKRWTEQGFNELIKYLSDSYHIILFGTIEESRISQLLINGADQKNVSNLIGKTNIETLVAEIADLDYFITGDSGPMHIAAAFQVPTVAIFGPTKDDETSQWMVKKSKIIKKNLDCQPCMKRDCPLGHHKCMKDISAQDVLRLFRDMSTD